MSAKNSNSTKGGMSIQPLLFAPEQPILNPLDSTYATSKETPFQRWFPYLEGFSLDFVNYVLDYTKSSPIRMLDPFGGNGTTAFAGHLRGINSFICEINPFMRDLFTIKSEIIKMGKEELCKLGTSLGFISETFHDDIRSQPIDAALSANYEICFGGSSFFDEGIFEIILKTKSLERKVTREYPLLGKIVMVAAASCLIESSKLKRAGDLRFKNDKEMSSHSPDFIKSFKASLIRIRQDILGFSGSLSESEIGIYCNNAKEISKFDGDFDIVITSPPYPNGTNYIRNTKVELWYSDHLGVTTSLRDLRDEVITAGINDITRDKFSECNIDSVKSVVYELKQREYDWRISALIESHFAEMSIVFSSIYHKLKSNSIMAIDIGDSAYAGVHVKVDKIYEDILSYNGFTVNESIHIRDRYSKGGLKLSQKLILARKL